MGIYPPRPQGVLRAADTGRLHQGSTLEPRPAPLDSYGPAEQGGLFFVAGDGPMPGVLTHADGDEAGIAYPGPFRWDDPENLARLKALPRFYRHFAL